ncbi:nicotinate (nicotinamide) nucleotide adenylyltransferase [Moraxella nonliquefaciens]|jgi:nicotinate-nucleotide adenylyltransferase|uniref:nicotinate (nicotinamide) nucleotide adenylyltransferase n=1 Tax=Moraxella nonliquefaciens TaxID=478 RepID=UPI001EF45C34|nr:nicotinate (nicotinamide) nucleotide adenylyltransferase [Moraxella nonliquefaciens]MCG7412765.1 nicotinate (nicotinamide) nucleotide adenylyltransferase [Moraxella nonliquefaciens]
MKRVFLGGSFDPVHDGHLGMICLVHQRLSSLDLPYVISFLPTAGNPFKSMPTNSDHRLNMLSLACDLLQNQGINISIDTTEIHQIPPVYTINTVQTLAQRYPTDERIFVMGGDSLANLHVWKNYEKILTHIKIWAFARKGKNNDDIALNVLARMTNDFDDFLKDKAIFYDKSPVPAISSTQIRQAITDAKQPPHLPEPIFDYIKNHQLYKTVL